MLVVIAGFTRLVLVRIKCCDQLCGMAPGLLLVCYNRSGFDGHDLNGRRY